MRNIIAQYRANTNLQAWSLLLLLSLIWGSSYILIKKSLVVYDPIQVASLRLGITAIAFFPFFLYHIRQLKAKYFIWLILVGIAGSGLPSFLYPIAQTKISSALAGSLSSLTPLFTLLTGLLFFKARGQQSKVLGILIGLAGALLLVVFGRDGSVAGQFSYSLLIVLAAICYAFSSNIVGFKLSHYNSMTISAFSFFMIGLPALIYVFAGSGFVETFQQTPGAGKALLYVSFLALFSTALASVLFFRLIQITDAVFGSTVSYIMPAIALSWGIMDGEKIGWAFFVGLGLILCGVYLSRKK